MLVQPFPTQIRNLTAREEARQTIHALKLSGLLRGGWITPGLQPAHGFPCLKQFLVPRQRVQLAAAVSQCSGKSFSKHNRREKNSLSRSAGKPLEDQEPFSAKTLSQT